VEISGDSDVKIQGWDFLSHTHTGVIGEVIGQATGTQGITGGVSSTPMPTPER